MEDDPILANLIQAVHDTGAYEGQWGWDGPQNEDESLETAQGRSEVAMAELRAHLTQYGRADYERRRQLKDALDHVSIRGLDEMRCWCRSRHIGSDYKPQHDPECLEARLALGIKETVK